MTGFFDAWLPWTWTQLWGSYYVDFWRRQTLFLDTLRQRGNNYDNHLKAGQPPVLAPILDYEIIMEGKGLEKPVNYALAKIIDLRGTKADRRKNQGFDARLFPAHDRRQINEKKMALHNDDKAPPVVIFDPRAGHGPGISGMNEKESQILLALDYGHPVFLFIFYTEPIPGQTIEDIGEAETIFLEKIKSLHPKSPNPTIIGNCQGGWAATLVGASRPDLVGSMELNGAPLSYWAGAAGSNPMRSRGSVSGGAFWSHLFSDLGCGEFDGGHIVKGFENLNKANSLWGKPYRLHSNIDNERDRFLNFETWWNATFALNDEEMEFIATELFIGNKLEKGELDFNNVKIDLHNLNCPLFINCSWSDEITPPEQALKWILVTYKSEKEIKVPIIFSIDDKIGHLGIFVSTAYNQKVHNEFFGGQEVWKNLKPGLYEVKFSGKKVESSSGQTLLDENGRTFSHFRIEKRTLQDLRDICGNDDDNKIFEQSKSVSDTLSSTYKLFFRPIIKNFVSPYSARLFKNLSSSRLKMKLFSDANPALWGLQFLIPLAESITPMKKDNLFFLTEQLAANCIENSIESFQSVSNNLMGMMFRNMYI